MTGYRRVLVKGMTGYRGGLPGKRSDCSLERGCGKSSDRLPDGPLHSMSGNRANYKLMWQKCRSRQSAGVIEIAL